MIMNKSPFKVMTTAALATALAVPAVATTAPATVDAAETEVLSVAISLDGEVQVVSYDEFVNAIFDGEGDVYDLYSEGTITAVSVEEGQFVKYEALSNALFDAEEGTTTTEVLAELNTQEDALVDEDTVAEYEDFGDDEVVEPTVESIEALNLKQASVTLAGNFDEEAAKNVENYTAKYADDSEVAVADVDLEDGVATLTFDTSVANQSELTLTVESEVTGETVSEELSFFDTNPPEVTNVEAIGENAIELSFNEPMDFGELDDKNFVTDSDVRTAFELNDGDKFVKDVKVLDNGTGAIVYFYGELEEGENSLTINNDLTDYAGYITPSEALEFEVEVDTEAPTLETVKNVTPLKATFVFSEPVDEDSVDATDFYHTNSNLKADSIVGINGNEVTVEWVENDALPNGVAYLYVSAESVMDLWGNENTQQLRTSVEVEIDESAPEIKEVVSASGSQKKLLVTFNEEVTSESAKEEDNYTITDENGDELEIADINETSNDNQFAIELENNASGNVTIEVDGVEDIYGNVTDDESVDYYVTDQGDPNIEKFTSVLYNEASEVQSLVVTFDGETMMTSGEYSVLDLEKYKVDNILEEQDDETYKSVNNVTLADLDGVSISPLNNGKQVKITLDTDEAGYKFESDDDTKDADSSDSDGFTKSEITMGQVKDASGNKSAFSGDFFVNAEGTVDVGDAVEATSTNTVSIPLADIVTDVDSDDFVVYAESNAEGTDGFDAADTKLDIVGKDLDNSGSTSVITFTLKDEQALNHDATYTVSESDKTVYVTTTGSIDTTNEFGEEVDIEEKVTDSISPVLDASMKVDGEYTTTYTGSGVTDVNELDLTFTEGVGGSADALGNYLTVDGYTFIAGGNPGDLSEDQYTIAGMEGYSNTVTVYVYENGGDEYSINLEPSRFLTDDDYNTAEFQSEVTAE